MPLMRKFRSLRRPSCLNDANNNGKKYSLQMKLNNRKHAEHASYYLLPHLARKRGGHIQAGLMAGVDNGIGRINQVMLLQNQLVL